MKKMVEFLTHLRELFGIRLGKVTLFFGIFAKVKEVFRFPIPDQFELMINQGARWRSGLVGGRASPYP